MARSHAITARCALLLFLAFICRLRSMTSKAYPTSREP